MSSLFTSGPNGTASKAIQKRWNKKHRLKNWVKQQTQIQENPALPEPISETTAPPTINSIPETSYEKTKPFIINSPITSLPSLPATPSPKGTESSDDSLPTEIKNLRAELKNLSPRSTPTRDSGLNRGLAITEAARYWKYVNQQRALQRAKQAEEKMQKAQQLWEEKLKRNYTKRGRQMIAELNRRKNR